MWHVCGDVSSMCGLVRKPGGERPLIKSRKKREDNIKVDNKEILEECVCVCVWTDVAHNRDKWWAVVNREMKLVKNY